MVGMVDVQPHDSHFQVEAEVVRWMEVEVVRWMEVGEEMARN